MNYLVRDDVRKECICELILCNSGDKDDDDDDDAEDKLQSSGIANGEHIRQESQEQSEVDHGDFEMVVSPECFSLKPFKYVRYLSLIWL